MFDFILHDIDTSANSSQRDAIGDDIMRDFVHGKQIGTNEHNDSIELPNAAETAPGQPFQFTKLHALLSTQQQNCPTMRMSVKITAWRKCRR